MTKKICYGCGRASEWYPHLSLCLACRFYKWWTGHNPNRLGYEAKTKEVEEKFDWRDQRDLIVKGFQKCKTHDEYRYMLKLVFEGILEAAEDA